MSNINAVARAGSVLVSTLPKFVLENYPKFVNFLRAYYTWSYSQGPDLVMESLKQFNDIDLVINEMLFSYKNSYAKHFPVELKTNFRHFAKFLREFYQLKGTEESYRIFFKAIFNEEASIFFPRVQIFKLSEATWNKDVFFKAIAIKGNPFNLIGSEILGLKNGYRALISNVIKIDDHYNIYFEEETGNFEVDEELVSPDYEIRIKILPIYKIKNFVSTQDWYDSSIIRTNGVILKVNKIFYGRIMNLNIVNGGTGYMKGDVITSKTKFFGSDFIAEVKTTDSNGAITGFEIKNHGFGYNHDDVEIEVKSANGTGAVLTPIFDSEFRKIKSISIIQNNVYQDDSDITVTLTNGTKITFTKGVTNTSGYWINTQSSLSTEYSKLSDSYYYQDFSYEIRSRADIERHKESLHALMHITGLKMFVKTIHQETVNVDAKTGIIFS